MDRKTLTGFILIGAILLLWPSYLEFISPSEKDKEDPVVLDSSLVEKYSETKTESRVTKTAENLEVETQSYVVGGKNFVAEISNAGGRINYFI